MMEQSAMNKHVLIGAVLTVLLLCGCQKTTPATGGGAAPSTTAAAASPADAKTDKPDAAATAPAGGAAPTDAKPDGDEKAAGDAKGGPAAEGVALTAEQIKKIGLTTQGVDKVDYTDEVAGYGSVIAHETIATAAAELATADATARQSRSALARSKRLANTPGALSTDVEETNLRQSAVDEAALTLARQRLSATFGQSPPWKDDSNDALLRQLANGTSKLVRVTFPLGELPGGTPKSLRAAHIGAAQGETGWDMTRVWPAPADASVPGRSFFAVLKGSDAGEGERLLVFAPVGGVESGMLIPAAAAVVSDGKFWCYVEKKPGTFERTEIAVDKPFHGGYFVTQGIAAGDKIVMHGAALLLAQESNSGAGAD